MNNTTLKMHKQKKSNVNTCSLCTQHKKMSATVFNYSNSSFPRGQEVTNCPGTFL